MKELFEMCDRWLEHPDNGFLVICILLCLVSLMFTIKDRPKIKRPN